MKYRLVEFMEGHGGKDEYYDGRQDGWQSIYAWSNRVARGKAPDYEPIWRRPEDGKGEYILLTNGEDYLQEGDEELRDGHWMYLELKRRHVFGYNDVIRRKRKAAIPITLCVFWNDGIHGSTFPSMDKAKELARTIVQNGKVKATIGRIVPLVEMTEVTEIVEKEVGSEHAS